MTEALTRIDLRRILARASSPPERLAATWLEPDAEAPDQSEALVAAWRKAVSSEPGEERWLQNVLGLSDASLLAMFGPVQVRDGAVLPAWARVIERALADDEAVALDPEMYVLGPFLTMARADLEQIIADSGLETSTEGRRGLLDMLAVRLGRVLGPSLEYEQNLINAMPPWLRGGAEAVPTLDGSREGWRQRLDMLPGLAAVVGVAYTHWHTFVGEICQRTAADRQVLADTFMAGRVPGALVRVAGDTGDVHNEGRAVAILHFANGERVVYKPKDLTVAAAWMDLIRDLNAADDAVSLPPRTILVRGAYTWEEYVAPRPCDSEVEVERFYQRMGQTIRLLQLLEARDFWLDNLIASGDAPHFIDMEMLLQPRRSMPVSLSAAELSAYDWIEESASRTSAISMPTPISPGVPSEELGALGPAGPFASPFRFELSALMANTVPPPLTPEGHVLWEHPEHVPMLEGVARPADAYVDQVLAGYEAMQHALVSQRASLLATDGPLAMMATAPIRHIARDTWSCLKLVNHSVQPAMLTDGAQRELFLAQLYRPAVAEAGRQPADVRLIAVEIDDLRQLDVPFFLSQATSDRVSTVSGNLDESLFPEPAWERLERRIAALADFPLDEHLALVRSSFATGRPVGAPWKQVPITHAAEPLDEPSAWVREASAIAAEVLDRSFDGEAWVGITYHPLADTPGLEVLRPDVLTGTSGLAMVFADLFAVTGEQRWRDAALRATQPSVRAFRDEVERAGRGLPSLASAGAQYGIGAWMRTFEHVGRVLDQPSLLAESQAGSAMVSARLHDPLMNGDLVLGPTGLVLTCLDLRPALVDAALATAWRSSLLAGLWSSSAKRPGRADHAMQSLPGPQAGAALALHRLQVAGMVPDDGEISTQLREWVRLTLAVEDEASVPAGTLLAVNEVSGELALDASVRDFTERWMAHWLERGDTWRLLDVIELSQQMRMPDIGGQAAARLVAQHRQCGSWFAGTYADDRHNLSATWGVMAVAHALVRLGAPVRSASIRLVGGIGPNRQQKAR